MHLRLIADTPNAGENFDGISLLTKMINSCEFSEKIIILKAMVYRQSPRQR